MKRFLRLSRIADLRLLVAVAACVVLFVATPTTPTDSSGCGGDTGTIAITNQSDWAVTVSVSGPQSKSTVVEDQGTGAIQCKVGYYAWKAVAGFSGGVHHAISGNVTVKKNAAAPIVVVFDK